MLPPIADTGLIEVSVTFPDEATADRIIASLLQNRLIACANRHQSVESTYRWQGALERGTEVLACLKTRATLFQAVSATVTKLHPYEVPAILAMPVIAVNDAYRDWVIAETRENP